MWVPAAVRGLGCGFDVGDAPGDDGVGEQSERFALDVLAVDVSTAELSLARWRSAASLVSAISCSTGVATSRGYALELFGALSLQTLRVAITTAAVVPSTKTLTPLLPTPQHLRRSPHPTRRSHPITAEGDLHAVGRLETVTFRPHIPLTPYNTD